MTRGQANGNAPTSFSSQANLGSTVNSSVTWKPLSAKRPPHTWKPGSLSQLTSVTTSVDFKAPSKKRVKRKALPAKRPRSGDDDVPLAEQVRRRRVSENTAVLYLSHVSRLMNILGLPIGSAEHMPLSVTTLDVKLSQFIGHLWSTGDEARWSRLLFYATRWHYVLANTVLPLSYAALTGHSRGRPEKSGKPVAWEEVLVRSVEVLIPKRAPGDRRTRCKIVIGWLLSFDIYARGGELVGMNISEPRAPQ